MTPCLICDNATHPLYDPEIKITHHVCETCGYTFKDPTARVDATEEKRLYSNHQNTMENTGYVNMFERFLAFTMHETPLTGPALDFGSGPGPVLFELLKRNGFESHHYDPYFYDDQSVFNRTYGFITSTEVFEHLSDPVGTFNALASLLKPGGTLAIMTSLRPDSDDAFLKWWYRRDQTHIGFFTLEAFLKLSELTPLTFSKTNNKQYFVFTKERSDPA